MVQNRNKFIELFISNISNSAVHEILEKAINIPEIASKYRKEIIASFDLAKKYRNKINPVNKKLAREDISYIKNKITRKVKAELLKRIEKGYKNINLNSVEEEINRALTKTGII